VRVEALADGHRRRLALPVAHGHVVDDRIARHDLERAGGGHVAASPPDHDTELALVVDHGRDARDVDRVPRSGDTRGLLVEEDGELGSGPAGLDDMVGVVQADGQELGGTGDRRAQAHFREGEPGRRCCRRGDGLGPAAEQLDRVDLTEINDLLADDHSGRGRGVVLEARDSHAADRRLRSG
jgi:hypothetical protein